MAAPKGNKYGKRFSSEYQPPEKWTKEKALELGFKLLDWLRAEDENLYFEYFLYVENSYPKNTIYYLRDKFKSFSKLLEDAKNIQKVKLLQLGTFDKLNATITKLSLSANHGLNEKQELKTEQKMNFNIDPFKKIRENSDISDDK